MKFVIFGASGKTGVLLTEQALEAGHQVTAYVRRAGSISQKHPNLFLIEGNLSDTDKIRQAIQGADAVFSTLGGGSLTKKSPEIVSGIGRITDCMVQEGVKRFVYLSSVGVGESRYYMNGLIRFIVADVLLRVPFADHLANEERLRASSLDWTLIRPGGLTDGPLNKNLSSGSEKITLKGSPKISRSGVAFFMLKQALLKESIRKALWVFEKAD
jgi:putative NADH-flavin reductase